MYEVIAQVEKVPGSLSAGYGIAFCAQPNGDFFFILITENGGYFVGEYVASTQTIDPISGTASNPWAADPNLYETLGVSDLVTIRCDSHEFDIDLDGWGGAYSSRGAVTTA